MRKHAYVTRAHSEDGFGERAEGDVILNMAPSQFGDFKDVGLVREATADEVANARAETVATKPAPSKRKKAAPRKAAKPAASPIKPDPAPSKKGAA